MKELQILKRELSNEHIASIYSDRFFSNLSSNKEAESYLIESFNSIAERYKGIEEISLGNGNNDLPLKLRKLLNWFPSFGFLLCNALDQKPDFEKYSKDLRIAVSLSTISRKTDYEQNSLQILEQIDPEADLKVLEERLSQPDDGYLIGMFNQDILQMINTHPTLKSSTDPHELIETIYYFSAIKQIFLKYYFFLLGNSKSDLIAFHINRIFSRALISLRNHEIKYWKRFKNGNKLRLQLTATVAKDSTTSRHPHLRKHIFELIDRFNPVIQDGSVKTTVIEVRQLLMKELALFYELSSNKLVLLLDTTQKTSGNSHVVFLLSQLNRTNIEKLSVLYDHVIKLNSDKTMALKQLVLAYTEKLPKNKRTIVKSENKNRSKQDTVYKTSNTARQVHAKKKLKESEGNRGLTQDQITEFLEERLKKLYERVKIEGALTQDKIPEYLAKFTEAAQLVAKPIPIARQKIVIEEFKNTTNEILEEISEQGLLTMDEIQVVKDDINEKAEGLDTTDVEKRTEIVDEIGVTLTEASFESEKRKEDTDLDAFFQKDIIPYGLDKKSKRISIRDFFAFPFGDFNGPTEEDWFGYHMRYLQLAVNQDRFDKSKFLKIFNSLNHLPKVKYKKYFNIFPNDQFEETTFMAVYDLWQNKAFDRLRIEDN